MADFLDEWRAWRDAGEQRRRSPQGWLSVTAIHWLSAAAQRFDDVPGEWSCDEPGLVVSLAADERLSSGEGVLSAGRHELGPVDAQGLRLSYADAVVELAARDGGVLLRPRRPDAANLRAYRGTPAFPPDERWVVAARFEPYPAPPAAVEDEAEVEVGEVAFMHEGAEHRLVAWGEDDASLWILFRDATSGVTTYAAMRQLLLPSPASDGSVEIDFNRASNMPCAYTEFAVCPVPPAANTLPFPVEAGERLPDFRPPDFRPPTPEV